MPPETNVQTLVELAVRHINAAQLDHARVLCDLALATHPPHAAVYQLLAVLDLKSGNSEGAAQHAALSLRLRADHVPTLLVAADAALAGGALKTAGQWLQRVVALVPDRAEVWFQLALLYQDMGKLPDAADALRQVLRLLPERFDAWVNLGIVLQENRQVDSAFAAYARAYQLDKSSFGRISHSLCAASAGRMWLSLDALRSALCHAATFD